MDTLSIAIENAIAKTERNMNDVSVDFTCDYSLDALERHDLHDLLWEYADGATPVYYHDIDEKCTDEILNAYLSNVGSQSIECSTDIFKIKGAAICFDFERQLFDDEAKILSVLFYKEILKALGEFEDYNFDAIVFAVETCLDKETYTLSALKAVLDNE